MNFDEKDDSKPTILGLIDNKTNESSAENTIKLLEEKLKNEI